MNYETRQFNELVAQDSLVWMTHLDNAIPEKYRGWINSRGGHIAATVLLSKVGEVLSNPTSEELHTALGKQVTYHTELQTILGRRSVRKSFLPYRYTEQLDLLFGQNQEVNILANSPVVSSIDKNFLHPVSVQIEDPQQLLHYNQLAGLIPVLPGAVCYDHGELERMSSYFSHLEIPYIYKALNSTDGNGIGEFGGSFPVVMEAKANFAFTMSVQYVNGVVGAMRENDKTAQDKRWKGNLYPFQDKSLNQIQNLQLQQDAIRYTELFARIVEENTGDRPVIFGLDYGVYIDNQGVPYAYLLDPNMRMAGNMFMYYQKFLIESAFPGVNVPVMQSRLLYGIESPRQSLGELSQDLRYRNLNLVQRDGLGRPRVNLNQRDHPFGISIIVHDPGVMTMVNAFGTDADEVEALLGSL